MQQSPKRLPLFGFTKGCRGPKLRCITFDSLTRTPPDDFAAIIEQEFKQIMALGLADDKFAKIGRDTLILEDSLNHQLWRLGILAECHAGL
jgi:hypothetical protein